MEKKYDHQLCEQKARKLWLEHNTYKTENNPGELYSIDTPPPTVSGSLHIGHIFSYTQTDVIARYKRMSGFSVFYPFGFDDNGLPTERYVEKKRAISAHSMKRSEFINVCLEETAGVEKQFEELWQRMGLSVDWDACYSTISPEVRKISQESFILLYKKGFVYRRFEPALYCTNCRTSVAQAELDDAEKPSIFNNVAFKMDGGTELIIATTRPELLSSCVALMYHPDDKRYSKYQGKEAIVPIFGNRVPFIADELVNPEKGTGLVMCCTFGDKTDILWYKKYKLPFKQSIGLDGRWIESTGQLAGLKAHAARTKIIELLKESNELKEQKPISHAVNVHERCKQEIEYLPLSQWFLNILEHKNKLIALADDINWFPSFMKQRYVNWVENVSWDWCLSRQRFFGIPFPVWHCAPCKEILLADINQLPVDPQEMHYSGVCKKCGSSEIVGDTDVMDTWNTSSLTPYICYTEFNKNAQSAFTDKEVLNFIPMSMRPQAHDIIRTWAFDTIIKVWMHHDTIPWRDIVISGHVLSDSKEKLSKSKENAKTDPEQLLKNYPADVIRYWTASGSLGYDMAFSETQLKIGQKLITKLWNAFLFVAEHTKDVKSENNTAHFGAINEWLLARASACFALYKKHLDQQEFNLALDAIEQFFWKDFCDNYLELVKDQLFKPENYKPELVAATKWTLYNVGLRILQLYSPYLPHICESIYQELYYSANGLTGTPNKFAASIHQTKFSDFQKSYEFDFSVHVISTVLSLITAVRKLKTEHQLSLKTELQQLAVYSQQEEHLGFLKREEQLIKGITHAHTINYQIGLHESGSKLTQDGEQRSMIIQL
ncbi:valine--tRNA ligase [Candidatus Dependentiae bacterium]|nr:valine--tRNA ligase [Candidatus Dependentiae bacterium]